MSLSTDTTYIAPFAVLQSTRSVDAQIKFYKSIEYVVDEGYEPLEGNPSEIPQQWFTARGVEREDLQKTVALRLPHDPYMHLILHQWSNLNETEGWPAPFNQVGSRGCSLLVRDVRSEMNRIRREFPKLAILQEPLTIRRKWGKTTSVLLKDPEDLWVELVEVERGSVYDSANVKPPPPNARTWLHFMHMCANFKETSKFYGSFGNSHDHGVDFRPETGFHPWGFEYFAKQQKEAFGVTMGAKDAYDISFYRAETDCSQMHIELLQLSDLKNPGPIPTWSQRGISRYCIKTKDYAGALKKAKADGHKIYVEDQRGCLNWGDSQWFFFADTDGNIVTLEEWFPQ
ncbi:hypothetical protein BHE90_013155, partial [Fusarium euwallaceae]